MARVVPIQTLAMQASSRRRSDALDAIHHCETVMLAFLSLLDKQVAGHADHTILRDPKIRDLAGRHAQARERLKEDHNADLREASRSS